MLRNKYGAKHIVCSVLISNINPFQSSILHPSWRKPRMVLRAGLIQQIAQQVMGPEEIFLGDMADFVSMEMSENTNNQIPWIHEITKVERHNCRIMQRVMN